MTDLDLLRGLWNKTLGTTQACWVSEDPFRTVSKCLSEPGKMEQQEHAA